MAKNPVTEATASESSAAQAAEPTATPSREEQLATENAKLRTQVTEYEAAFEGALGELEILRSRKQALETDHETLQATYSEVLAAYHAKVEEHARLFTEHQALLEARTLAAIDAPSAKTADARRYRARFRLGLTRGDVMPGDEFDATPEEIEGLRIGEHIDLV